MRSRAEKREQVSGLPASESLCVVSLGISFKEVKHNLEGQGAEGQKDQQRGRKPREQGVW